MAKVGGLGEAVAGLAGGLRSLGCPIETIIPDYGNVALAGESVEKLNTPPWVGECWVRRGVADGFGPVSLIGTRALHRPHPYNDPDTGLAWADNDDRFFGFSAGVAALIDRDLPDLVHVHDWHGAASTLLATHRPPTVLTIHNLAHHGLASLDWSHRLGAAATSMLVPGHIDPLVGAIRTANAVLTVSPTYRREICTTAGEGITEILCAAADRLYGIRNGLDHEVWDPANDPRLPFAFDSTDLAGKAANRYQLLTQLGRVERQGPIVALVARMTEQKGIDLALRTASSIAEADGLLVLHGDGQRSVSELARSAASIDPAHVMVLDGFDETTAHRLMGGSDLFLMPSRFEPCGLTQLQAMTYGTIPIVTDVGGLHDTVVDADRYPSSGTGFVAATPTGAAVVEATRRAIDAWCDRLRWREIQARAMSTRWSWTEPANEHIEIYRQLLAPAGPVHRATDISATMTPATTSLGTARGLTRSLSRRGCVRPTTTIGIIDRNEGATPRLTGSAPLGSAPLGSAPLEAASLEAAPLESAPLESIRP